MLQGRTVEKVIIKFAHIIIQKTNQGWYGHYSTNPDYEVTKMHQPKILMIGVEPN